MIVGMVQSIHLARWVSSLPPAVEVEVMASQAAVGPHSALDEKIPVHLEWYGGGMLRFLPKSLHRSFYLLRRLVEEGFGRRLYERKLGKLLRSFRPDIVHSMETQSAGYLVESVLGSWKGDRPKWYHSTWGSDIFLFGRLPDHCDKVRRVVSACDRLIVDCDRDASLVAAMNNRKLDGDKVSVLPVCAGLDLGALFSRADDSEFRPVSSRNVILIKGYQSWAGRALTVLRGLERCREEIEGAGLEVVVFAVSTEDVRIKIELMQFQGFPVTLIEQGVSELDLYQWFARSRLFIAAGISDGTPVSMLEAMAAGCYPIQSRASAASEWIEDGVDGLLIEGEDSDNVREAVISALGDPERIDRAALSNRTKLAARIGPEIMAEAIKKIYGDEKGLSE